MPYSYLAFIKHLSFKKPTEYFDINHIGIKHRMKTKAPWLIM